MPHRRLLVLFCSLVLSAACFCFSKPVLANSCIATVTGDWNNAATWSSCGGSTPGSADTATINSGVTVDVTANTTVSSLTFSPTSSAATVTVDLGMQLTVTSTILLNSSATTDAVANMTGSGTVSSTSLTVGLSSTVPASTQVTQFVSTIATFIVSGTARGISTKSGSFTNTGEIDLQSGSMTLSSIAFTPNTGLAPIFTLASGAQSATLSIISSGTPIGSGGTFIANGTSATVNYIALNGATNISNVSYHNLGAGIVAGAAVTSYTIVATTTVDGVMTFGASSGSTHLFSVGTSTLILSGSGTPLVRNSNGSLVTSSSTIMYSGSGTINIATITNYNNLVLGANSVGSGQTFAVSGGVTVLGALVVNTPASGTHTLSLGSNTLTLTGSGTPLLMNGNTISGNGSTVAYQGQSATTIAGTTYANISVGVFTNTTNNTYTAGGDMTITGAMTIGATSGSGIHGFHGATSTVTFAGSGTPFRINSSGSFTAASSTINYAATGTTGVMNTTYYNLGIGVSADAFTTTFNLSGSTTVVNILTIGASSGSTHTLSGIASNFFFLGSGSVFAINSAGTFLPSTGTTTFQGSGAQTIADSVGTAFNDVVVNTPSGVTLTHDATIGGTLVLTNGSLITGSRSIIVSSDNAVSRTNGFVVGTLQMHVATGATSKIFPLGSGTTYAPLDVLFGNVSVAGSLSASTTATDHPSAASSGIDPSKSLNRYYSTQASGLTFTTYSAIFHYASTDLDAAADPTTFIVKKYASGIWTAPTVGTRTSTSTQITGASSFSDFEIGNADVPPVVIITAQTLTSSSTITNTTIRVTDTISVSSTSVMIDPSSTAGTSGLNCSQTSSTQVDCTLDIASTGTLVVDGVDGLGNAASSSQTGYVIDSAPPIITITAPTLTSSSTITNTTIRVTDVIAVSSTSVIIDSSSTAGTSGLSCSQTSSTQVDCMVSIVSSGSLVVDATDWIGNMSSSTQAGYTIDATVPVIAITAPTLTSSSTITNTTIRVTDNRAVSSTGVTIDASSSAGASGLSCSQTSSTQVDCTISITSSGTVKINASDTLGNSSSSSQTGYTIDTAAPIIIITAPTLASSSTITNTTIRVTDDVAVSSTSVTIDPSSTAGTSSFSCSQTSSTQVDCTISITSSGSMNVHAFDSVGNSALSSRQYTIDVSAPFITITAPTLASSSTITNTTIRVTDDVAVSSTLVTIDSLSSVGTSGFNCSQTSSTQVDCTINITTSGDLRIDATDGLGNSSSSSQTGYVLDGIAPTVVITAPTLSSSSTITNTTIRVTDTISVSSTSVTVNPSSTAGTSGFSCSQTSSTQVDCTVSITSSGDLLIDAADWIGNSSSSLPTTYVIDATAPNIIITAPMLASSSTITNTTIRVTDVIAVSSTSVIIDSSSTAGASGLSCSQTSSTQVDCTISITSSGTLVIQATDWVGNEGSTSRAGYVIDTQTPIIRITAPTLTNSTVIPDTTVRVTDAIALSAAGVVVDPSSTAGTSSFQCNQTSSTQVDCTLNITSSGALVIQAMDSVGNSTSVAQGGYLIVAPTTPTVPQATGGGGLSSVAGNGTYTSFASTDVADLARVDVLTQLGLRQHDLVKLPDDGNAATQADSAVYYLGADGRRHAFPNEKVYFSWYCNFSGVDIVAASDLAKIPLGKNVTYRSGLRLVKFPSVPRVSVVQPDAILRGIPDEITAVLLFGPNWNTRVSDISEAFFGDYTTGPMVTDADIGMIKQLDVASLYPSANFGIRGYADSPTYTNTQMCLASR